MGTVIIHSKATTQIQIAHWSAFLEQSSVNPGSFHHASADIPDIGDLRAQVIMQELETIQHVMAFQIIDNINYLGGSKSKG